MAYPFTGPKGSRPEATDGLVHAELSYPYMNIDRFHQPCLFTVRIALAVKRIRLGWWVVIGECCFSFLEGLHSYHLMGGVLLFLS